MKTFKLKFCFVQLFLQFYFFIRMITYYHTKNSTDNSFLDTRISIN